MAAEFEQLKAPTIQQNEAYLKAFRHLNNELFEGKLPEPMLCFSRNSNMTGGHFSPNKWADEAGEKVHEVAMNANLMKEESLETLFGYLLHEMVHIAQWEEETIGRAGYHNKDFADRCERIGLTAIGPDGKNTGQMMATSINEGGPAQAALRTLPEDAIIPWFSDPLEIEKPPPGGGGGEAPERKPGSRSKYTCAQCGLNAWAAPRRHLMCGDCLKPLIEPS